MKKLIFVISFIVLSGFLFGLSAQDAKAQTVTDLQTQIQQLMAQIAALQQRLAQLQGATTTWCHNFNVNLKIGDSGTEVKALRTALTKEGFSGLEAMGGAYQFDERLASAVVGFQEKYVSEILTPWRLVRGTGYVGPSTRAKLNKLYGCRLTCQTLWWHDNNHQYCQQKQFCGAYMYPGLSTFQTKEECEASLARPSIILNYVQSPAQEKNILKPGEKAIVYGSNLSIGTEDIVYVRMMGKAEDRRMRAYNISRNNLDFIIPNVDPGEYDLFVERGGIQSNKIKVKVMPGIVPSISIKSPKQGDIWAFGAQQFISWDSIGINKLVIYLWFPDGATCLLADNVSASLGRYAISVLENQRCSNIARNIIAGNQYRVRIISIDDPALELAAPRASSGYFGIITPTTTCTDSDDGKNYYQKGTVIYDEKGYTDYCLGAFYLREYFCLPQSSIGLGGVAYEDIVCPNNYSCRDGACVPPESPPSVTSISPAFGVINDTITIYGKNLIGTKPSGIIVEFLENGVVRGTISSPITESSDGSYLKFLLSGTFVGMQGTGTYQVRVLNDYGKSNTVNFTIVEKSITVISPNGGERLVRGNVCAVRWESKGVNLVRIYVFNSNIIGSGSTNYIVPNNQAIPASQGYYNWTIGEVGLPVGVDEGAVYKIRIDDVDSNLFDSSDNYFSIVSSGLGLKNIENQLASLTEAVFSLIEQVRILMGR